MSTNEPHYEILDVNDAVSFLLVEGQLVNMAHVVNIVPSEGGGALIFKTGSDRALTVRDSRFFDAMVENLRS